MYLGRNIDYNDLDEAMPDFEDHIRNPWRGSTDPEYLAGKTPLGKWLRLVMGVLEDGRVLSAQTVEEVKEPMKTLPVIDMDATGQNIRRLLQERNIIPQELCELMHISSVQSVYHWMQGKSLPTVDHLVDLARVLDVTMEEILVMKDGL